MMMPNPPEPPVEPAPPERISDELTRSGRPGMRCGSYTLEELVDCGGFSEVWKAGHAVVGHPSAVKLLRPTQTGAEVRRRFEQEILLVAKIQHENVVGFLDSGFVETETGERVLWLAMELLDGASLRARLNEGERFTVEEALRIGFEICCGVGQAHRLNVVHRDIKPENVIVTRAGVTKVLGIAKFYGWGFRTTGRMRGALGTPSYMSPEQMQGNAPPTFASDVFQIGLIIYELCAGRPPFSYANGEMPTHAQLFELRIQCTPPPLSELGVAPEVSAVIERALRPDPLERYATAGDFGDALWSTLREQRRRRDEQGAAACDVNPASSRGEPLGPLAKRVYQPATTAPANASPAMPAATVVIERNEKTSLIDPPPGARKKRMEKTAPLDGPAPSWRAALIAPAPKESREAVTRRRARTRREQGRALISRVRAWVAPRLVEWAVQGLVFTATLSVLFAGYYVVPWGSLLRQRAPSAPGPIEVPLVSTEPAATPAAAAEPAATAAAEPAATAAEPTATVARQVPAPTSRRQPAARQVASAAPSASAPSSASAAPSVSAAPTAPPPPPEPTQAPHRIFGTEDDDGGVR